MAEKRALFRVFLETLRDPNLTSEHKIKCLTLVVIPVLTTTLEDPHTNNSEVVTDALVSNVIVERPWGDAWALKWWFNFLRAFRRDNEVYKTLGVY